MQLKRFFLLHVGCAAAADAFALKWTFQTTNMAIIVGQIN